MKCRVAGKREVVGRVDLEGWSQSSEFQGKVHI